MTVRSSGAPLAAHRGAPLQATSLHVSEPRLCPGVGRVEAEGGEGGECGQKGRREDRAEPLRGRSGTHRSAESTRRRRARRCGPAPCAAPPPRAPGTPPCRAFYSKVCLAGQRAGATRQRAEGPGELAQSGGYSRGVCAHPSACCVCQRALTNRTRDFKFVVDPVSEAGSLPVCRCRQHSSAA